MASNGQLSKQEKEEAHQIYKILGNLIYSGLYKEKRFSIHYAILAWRLRGLRKLCEHFDRDVRCPDCCERDPSI